MKAFKGCVNKDDKLGPIIDWHDRDGRMIDWNHNVFTWFQLFREKILGPEGLCFEQETIEEMEQMANANQLEHIRKLLFNTLATDVQNYIVIDRHKVVDLLQVFYKRLRSWHLRQKTCCKKITRETLNAIDHLLNGRSVY